MKEIHFRSITQEITMADLLRWKVRITFSGIAIHMELHFPDRDCLLYTSVPFAKIEFGMGGDVYFTDGPCVFRAENELYMFLSLIHI